MLSTLSKQARCRLFSYDEIKKATSNFDDSNIIGKGGEGEVYKGTIVTDGQNKTIPIAVKRLKFNSKEFQKEIDMLSELHHANLVSLMGYCQQYNSKILVYEFVANKSLHEHICKKDGCTLSWEQRLKICIGAARGLDYLHTGTSNEFKIIHRDVKPANILLDENLAPKISDFGLSRKGPTNQARSAVSTAAKGTVGYYAPECFTTGQITTKVDVYAFGVVLFEVLCRKKPWERLRDDSNTEDQSAGQWAYENIDKFLTGAISRSCFEVFIDIAEKCLTKDPSQRPSMSEVVSKLDYALKLQKRDSEAGKSAMLQNYRKTSEPGAGVIGRSNSSEFEESSKQQGSGSSKATISDNRLQNSDLWTTRTGNSARASTERASGRSQSTKHNSGSNEPSTSRNTSNRMTPKVETRPYNSLPRSQDIKIQENVASSGKINWAYTSRRSKSMAGTGSSMTPSRRTLPDIPGTERKIVLYSCVQTHTDCHKIRVYLNIYKVVIEERDPTKDEKYRAELSHFFSRTQRQYCLPQLFIGGKYVGGFAEVDRLYCSGELKELLSAYQV